MNSGRTLYQILSVSAAASDGEIRSAYQDELRKLEERRNELGFEEYESKRKLIQVAYETLSDPMLRRGYDERLMSRKSGLGKKSSQSTALSLEVPENLANNMDALAFRAEAIALRADALAVQSSLRQYGLEPLSTPPKSSRSIFTWTRMLVVVGLVIAMSMAMQTFMFYSAVKKSEEAGNTSQAAQEKAALQEYYQTYGVRPASMEEMYILDANRRAQEIEERELSEIDRQRQRDEEEERRRLEEARREGERISAELKQAEERAKFEEAQELREKEMEEKRRREEYEETLRQARKQWDKSGSGHGGSYY